MIIVHLGGNGNFPLWAQILLIVLSLAAQASSVWRRLVRTLPGAWLGACRQLVLGVIRQACQFSM